MAYIICSDDIKQTLPGYDPAQAGDFHDESTRLADAALERALTTRPEKRVILMSGGSASGKSEYVSAYLRPRRVIVSDGTFSNPRRAENKVRTALRAGKQVEICAVWPDNFFIAFRAFVGRERQFDAAHFYRTHSQSRRTLLEIAQLFPQVAITVVVSSYVQTGKGVKMVFREQVSGSRPELIEYIVKNQYTEEEIKQIQRVYEI